MKKCWIKSNQNQKSPPLIISVRKNQLISQFNIKQNSSFFSLVCKYLHNPVRLSTTLNKKKLLFNTRLNNVLRFMRVHDFRIQIFFSKSNLKKKNANTLNLKMDKNKPFLEKQTKFQICFSDVQSRPLIPLPVLSSFLQRFSQAAVFFQLFAFAMSS